MTEKANGNNKTTCQRMEFRAAKRRDHCAPRKTKNECDPHDIQIVQPFPTHGLLATNLGLTLPRLVSQIGQSMNEAYSYVVQTVKLNGATISFEQHGSAPNFQGDVLTLCTCKYQMRASRDAQDWPGLWLAGLTSRTIHEAKHWLFYLARIESAHESQSDLWVAMEDDSRNAKAAHRHFLGDIFRPRTPLPNGAERFSPKRYFAPTLHSHRLEDNDYWHNDINYPLAPKYGHPPLLVVDPKRTFIWNEPIIYLSNDHCRNYFRWSSVQELLGRLKEFGQ